LLFAGRREAALILFRRFAFYKEIAAMRLVIDDSTRIVNP
jgi:hypothetical protein